MFENKNYVVAIVLSLAILLGWQYFVVQPGLEARREAQVAALKEEAAKQGVTAVLPGETRPSPEAAPATAPQATSEKAVAMTREEAIAATPRVEIKTESLSGSVNLRGARIDDLHLSNYRETVDDNSPTITLLSPSGSEHPYYAEFDWTTDPGANVTVPDAQTVWTQESTGPLSETNPLVLSWDNGEGLTFRRTISVDKDYMFTVTQSVANATDQEVKLYPYGLISRHGTPDTKGFYILHEGLIGVFGDQGLKEVKYADLKEEKAVRGDATNNGWLGITDKYWATALIPADANTQFQPRFSYIPNVDGYQADYLGNAVSVPAGGQSEAKVRLFAGAKEVNVINKYDDEYSIHNFDLMIDWGWFYFITKPMFWMIDLFYKMVGNFGIAILLATVVVKLIFFPLANKSYVSMSRMKKVQPQMAEIRERYKDDKAQQQKAMMELYKTEKINPLAGCLPMIIQIPVFFSLYKVLYVTIEMRHAPFFGWIHDLSAPDPTSVFTLFGLVPWDHPAFMSIGIWPLIMGVTMFLQMKMNPTPAEPAQQMIFNWMPVMFTFMLGSFPAGLVIYWAWNNSLSILQQYVIMRRQGVKMELFDNVLGTFKRKKSET
ncbi:membrane protein insertase YidC [Breoghania sp.]|uniref:membrane protein insertase YidC n=1 Tax=Breoghania sp. TaxID=2065378 RepID=UPI002AABF4F8|nr:membrane protein insertase YidC [Breoghania sp.]